MLVISAVVIACTGKEYEVLSVTLNDWARKSKVELEMVYYPTSSDFSSCHMRDSHIVFVGTSMEGDQNGLLSARMFKKCGTKLPIVLFPDNGRHPMDSYEIDTLYLAKTSKKVDIEHCMECISEITSNANSKLGLEDTTFYIPYDNILYIQGTSEESSIVMREGLYKLCLYLEELDHTLPKQFIWCTAHILVNIEYARQIEKKGLLLWNDEQLEINPDCRQAAVFTYINKVSQGELIMVGELASCWVDHTIENGADKEQRVVYVYGLICFINELFSNALLLTIVPPLNRIRQVVIWMMAFGVLRFNIGGYHADTPIRCIVESAFIGVLCTLVYPFQVKGPYSSV